MTAHATVDYYVLAIQVMMKPRNNITKLRYHTRLHIRDVYTYYCTGLRKHNVGMLWTLIDKRKWFTTLCIYCLIFKTIIVCSCTLNLSQCECFALHLYICNQQPGASINLIYRSLMVNAFK